MSLTIVLGIFWVANVVIIIRRQGSVLVRNRITPRHILSTWLVTWLMSFMILILIANTVYIVRGNLADVRRRLAGY